MIQIAGIGEDIIMAAMKEYDTAQGEDKLIYAERMRAKIEAVMDMSRQPDVLDIETLRRIWDTGCVKTVELLTKEPEAKEQHPMTPEDINNVDVVVKKKRQPRQKDRQKELDQVEKLMKAGKSAKEIADETGRDGKDILDDMKWIRGQGGK